MGISGSQSASRGLSSGEKPPSVQWPIWVRSGCPEGPLSSRKLSKSGRVEVFEGPSGTESYPFSMLAKNSPDGTRLVRSTDTKRYLVFKKSSPSSNSSYDGTCPPSAFFPFWFSLKGRFLSPGGSMNQELPILKRNCSAFVNALE